MGGKLVETLMGAAVLAVAGVFLVFAFRQADVDGETGYEVRAAFTNLGGLEMGSDVRINGIRVGTVTDQRLDPQTFMAVVRLNIARQYPLPADTTASIASEGLLGGKHIRLDPGRSQERVPPGGEITDTKDYKSLEELVGEIIFMATGDVGGPTSGVLQ